MNGFLLTRILILTALLCGLPRATFAAPAGVHYETGLRNITNLQSDLVLALDRKKRPQVSSRAELLTGVRLPCLASTRESEVGTPVRVSAGFIDFVNRLAHAKAIDQTERGFFAGYTTQVAQQTPVMVPEFDTRAVRTAWDFNTMNRQASHFNQMAGALLAIDLAHHYLGHYRKHAPEFSAGSAFPTPINAVLTESEWRNAVLRGAQNALACGLGTEGLRAVFECFEQMPARPAWAAYFIHPKANVAKINLELSRLERDFFAMNQHLQKLGPGE